MHSTSTALERLLKPASGTLPNDFARELLALDFSAEDRVRYETLSLKAQDGTLASGERTELEDLVTADDVLTILQAKAASSLGPQSMNRGS